MAPMAIVKTPARRMGDENADMAMRGISDAMNTGVKIPVS